MDQCSVAVKYVEEVDVEPKLDKINGIFEINPKLKKASMMVGTVLGTSSGGSALAEVKCGDCKKTEAYSKMSVSVRRWFDMLIRDADKCEENFPSISRFPKDGTN